MKVAQSCLTLFDPWTIQSMEFSRPEYLSREPFRSPGDLPNPGIKLRSPTLWVYSLPAEPQGKPLSVKFLFKYGLLANRYTETSGLSFYHKNREAASMDYQVLLLLLDHAMWLAGS